MSTSEQAIQQAEQRLNGGGSEEVMEVINQKTLQHHLATIDTITMTRPQAEALFKFLMTMGATKDLEIHLSESGSPTIKKTFIYQLWDGEKDSDQIGTQFYTLGNYLKLLVRFDKAAWKRMRNVEQKVQQMHAKINASVKQMYT